MSKDNATSLLVLTGEESALIRKVLANSGEDANSGGKAMAAFNRGMLRGTERLAAEFAEKRRAKKAGSK